MVCPILEYGNLIWGAHFKINQIATEKCSIELATRLLKSLQHLTYQDNLIHLIPQIHSWL